MPSLNIPIIFDVLCSKATRDPNSDSWSNEFEIQRVLYYVKELINVGINGQKIKPEDIGIISPYKKQVSLTKENYNLQHFINLHNFSIKKSKKLATD